MAVMEPNVMTLDLSHRREVPAICSNWSLLSSPQEMLSQSVRCQHLARDEADYEIDAGVFQALQQLKVAQVLLSRLPCLYVCLSSWHPDKQSLDFHEILYRAVLRQFVAIAIVVEIKQRFWASPTETCVQVCAWKRRWGIPSQPRDHFWVYPVVT